MKKMLIRIFLHLLGNFVLSIISIFFGISLCFIFYPIYFEKYSYLTYFIIFLVIFIFIKKKKILTIIYLINFLIITIVMSYGVYQSFFFTRKDSEIILEHIKDKCKDAPNNTDNINCKYYRIYENK